MSESVVVVGGGTAGSVVAARLSERPGVHVTLLEEGEDDSAYDHTVLDPRWAGRVWDGTSRFVRPFQMEHDPAHIPMIRGHGLGGTSAVNYLASVRGQPADYDSWADAGAAGWGWHDVAETFRMIENDLDFPAGALHGHGGPLTVRRWTPTQHDRCQAAFADGLGQVGIPRSADINDPAQLPGVGSFPATIVAESGERLSVSRAYLTDEVRARPNLDIVTSARVAEILISGTTARGVRLVDDSELEADCVVVCCGAIESPALLQRSGIGPQDVLDAAGVIPRVDLPVGRRLGDHLGPVVPYSHPGDAGGDGGPAQPVMVGASNGSDIDFHMFPTVMNSAEGTTTFGLLTFLLRSSHEGSVSINSPDPAETPTVHAPPLPHDAHHRLRPAIELIGAWEKTAAFAALRASRLVHVDLESPDAVGELLTAWTMSYGHMTSSCAIGPVLDTTCAVRGVDGLRVVDTSSMPTIPAGNTYLGAVMIAERASQLMGDELR